MKHVFASLIGILVVILAFSSVYFLIHGWPEQVQSTNLFRTISDSDSVNTINSSVTNTTSVNQNIATQNSIVNSHTNNTSIAGTNSTEDKNASIDAKADSALDCDTAEYMSFDIKQSGHIFSSSNYKFSITSPQNLDYSKTSDNDGFSYLNFTIENSSFNVVFAPVKFKIGCDKQIIGRLNSYDTTEKLHAVMKKNRSPNTVSLLGTDEFEILSSNRFVSNGATYFESETVAHSVDSRTTLYEATVTIVRPGTYMYAIGFSSTDGPIQQSTVDEIVSNLTFK